MCISQGLVGKTALGASNRKGLNTGDQVLTKQLEELEEPRSRKADTSSQIPSNFQSVREYSGLHAGAGPR